MKNTFKTISMIVCLIGIYATPTPSLAAYWKGDIGVTATLDGNPWTGNVDYTLTGPENFNDSSVSQIFKNKIADGIYTLNYFGGGPAGAILNSISPILPVSSQFLPDGTLILFNFNFISGSSMCPLTPQPERIIISFEPYKGIGSPDYATYTTGPYSFGSPLSIGTYDVTLVSYDHHTSPGGSGWQSQPNEQYYLKLLDQNNNLVTSTNATVDIPNNQNFVTTIVNTNFSISNTLYSVKIWHEAYIDNSDYNSLYPICAAFDKSFDYLLSNSGTSSVTKTSSDTFTQNIQNTITKTLISGSTQSVTLSLSGVPSGVSYSISNSSCSPTCTSVITFTVTPSAPVGNYTITVTASPLNKSTQFTLSITGNPMTVSCSVNPSTAYLGQTITWTASVSGGTAPLTYSWSGTSIPTSPAPTSNPYSRSYSTVGQKTATVMVTDADSVQANCPPATIQINFDPKLEEF